MLTLEVGRAWSGGVLGGLAPLVAEGRALYCVDGANCFDPYAFSHHARLHGAVPEELLDRVFVTRAFTIHQLLAVTAEMLPALAGEEPRPVLVVLGLEQLFLEETLPMAERRRVLSDVMRNLAAVRDGGISLLVTFDPPQANRGWWKPMIDVGDIRGALLPDVAGQLVAKKPRVQVYQRARR